MSDRRKGRPLSKRELEIILKNKPAEAKRKLANIGKERTLGVIRATRYRAKHKPGPRKFGGKGQKAAPPWSYDDLRKLRRVYTSCTNKELQLIFPGRTYDTIGRKARELGLEKGYKIRPRYTASHVLMQEVQRRALEDGISMAALDRETGGRRRYWEKQRLLYPDLDEIERAVEFFGGVLKIKIDWRDR